MSVAARRFQRAIVGTSAPSTSPISDAGSLPVGSASYSVPGGAIFMATNGLDTNSGTIGSPVATLTKAISLVSTGGTIVVRAGTYNEGEDTQDSGYPMGVVLQKSITIQNYPNEAVWFDGSTPVTGAWTSNSGTWNTPYDRIFNRSPTNNDGKDDGWGATDGSGGWWTDPSVPQACYPDMVFYDGVQLVQVATMGEVVSGTFFIEGADTGLKKWFQGTKIHIGDNPAGHQIRYANKCKFMTLAGFTYTTTIRGVGIRRYASFVVGHGTIYNQHDLTLENVWCEDVRAEFMSLDTNPAFTMTKVTALRVGNNVIGSNQADNVTIDRADFRQANYAKWNIFGPSIATIKLNKCQYVTIKNSIFKDIYGSGFWCDSTCNTPIIANCLFQNITNRPIDYETAGDGVIANCKFISNGADTIFINDSDTTRIYNCTLAENNWGYRGTGGTRGVDTSPNVSPISIGQSHRRYDNSNYSFNIDTRLPSTYYSNFSQHQWTINAITVINTVVARPGVHAYDMFISGNGGDDFRAAGRTFVNDMHPTMNGNVYHWTSQPQYPWVAATGYQVNPQVSFSLTAWRTNTGMDLNSSFTTSDPLNTSYQITNQTYHNNAVALPSDIAALIGQPAGSKNAGAYW